MNKKGFQPIALIEGKIYTGGKNRDTRKLLKNGQYQIKVEQISGRNQGEVVHISRQSFLSWLRAGK